MDLEAEEIQSKIPVTILKVVGVLDATNYQELINKAHQLYQTGTRELILDFSQLTFMSSSGILSLHDIAIMLRSESPQNIGEDSSDSPAISYFVGDETHYEQHLKLLNPQPRVRKSLETTGFDHVIKIFNDRAAAIASFQVFPDAS